MSIFISGSLAFDNILRFEGKFSDHILPNHLDKLNVSFYAAQARREFGGCAGNIAYGLTLLGEAPYILATLGSDGGNYFERIQNLGLPTEGLLMVTDASTATAIILTDNQNNQITVFHPGAMMQAARVQLQQIQHPKKPALGIVSPNNKDAMLAHAEQFHAAGIPFVFDPGQALPLFDRAELLRLVQLARWLVVNEYEASLVMKVLGQTEVQAALPPALPPELQIVAALGTAPASALAETSAAAEPQQSQQSQQFQEPWPHPAFFVTLGEKGTAIWQRGRPSAQVVAATKASAVQDPTGCGDAWRAGLLYGLARNWEAADCAALGNRMGAAKIASMGGQNYPKPANT